ncbi:MAG: DNA-processing protein DprA [Muribaculum sp.]|nr:DNA-processing protein DprA [Muribaculum sp.]
MDSNRLLGVALSFLPGVDARFIRHILEQDVTLPEFFQASQSELAETLSLKNSAITDKMVRDDALFRARKEAEFMEKHGITTISITDEDYPVRLSDIDKAPVTLYKLGSANLDAKKMMSIVGTRHATAYGARYVDTLVREMAPYFPELTIVSGLALGIDSVAHSAALNAGLPTVAVVAHGLNIIYPSQNRDLARRIVGSGGAIISEYPFGVSPFKSRFLERNRIVATLTDAVVVAESAVRGGAMSTAAVASSYGRELFALPGRLGDEMSAGCNRLIRSQKALMAGDAADMIAMLGWKPLDVAVTPQKQLFPELNGIAKSVFDCLQSFSDPLPMDVLRERTGIPVGELMSLLGELEFDGIIQRLPGNRFTII